MGKTSALIATAIVAASMSIGGEPTYAMLLLVLTLYLTQAMSVVHAVFAQRKLAPAWIFALYVVMIFVPHIVVLLIAVGISDAWIDFRRRLAA